MSWASLDAICDQWGIDRDRFPKADQWPSVFTQAVLIGPEADAWLSGMAELVDVGWVVQSVSVVAGSARFAPLDDEGFNVEADVLLVGIARRLSEQQIAQMRGGPPGIVVPQPAPGSVSPLRPV